jgi:hypothetical protein
MIMKKVYIILLFIVLGCGRQEQQSHKNVIFRDPSLVITEVIHPDFGLPDSLGGKKAKGWIDIISGMNIHGELLSHRVSKIKISYDTSEPKTIYSIYDGITSEAAQAEMTRYEPWVSTYLVKARFKIKYDTSNYRFSPQDTLWGGVTIWLNSKN